MKRILIIFLFLVVIAKICNNYQITELERPIIIPPELTVFDKNLLLADSIETYSLHTIVLSESFDSIPYFCGVAWTSAFGNTIHPDGRKVTRKDAPVTKEYGLEMVKTHFRDSIYPYLSYFEVELSAPQLVSVISLMYNVGGQAVTGFDVYGNRVKKTSRFLIELNKLKDVPEKDRDKALMKIALCMLDFRRAGKEISEALLARRWFEMALFLGKVPLDVIGSLKTAGFYGRPNLKMFYRNIGFDAETNKLIIPENKVFIPRLDDNTINRYIIKNLTDDANVAELIK